MKVTQQLYISRVSSLSCLCTPFKWVNLQANKINRMVWQTNEHTFRFDVYCSNCSKSTMLRSWHCNYVVKFQCRVCACTQPIRHHCEIVTNCITFSRINHQKCHNLEEHAIRNLHNTRISFQVLTVCIRMNNFTTNDDPFIIPNNNTLVNRCTHTVQCNIMRML